MVDLKTPLPVVATPIMIDNNETIIGLVEMTSLRGLDGLYSKQDSEPKQGKQTLTRRDESVLSNFVNVLSRRLIDINDREISTGKPSIFSFDFSDAGELGRYRQLPVQAARQSTDQTAPRTTTESQDSFES